MPFRDDKHFLLSLETITSDEDAQPWLPPYAMTHTFYVSRRAEGLSPREALQQTLALWREFQESARPCGYNRAKTYEEEAA